MAKRLIRTGELSGAVDARTFLAAGDHFADDVGVQRTRTLFGKLINLRAARAILRHHAEHLRDDVAGALYLHGIAHPHIKTRDLIGIMQRRVLHHDTADRHRLELGDRRQRAGAPDLDFDVADDGGRLLGRKLVRDRPARRARHEAEPPLPVEPVDFINHAVDVVIEAAAPQLDLAVKGEQFIDRAAHFGQRIGLEAATPRTT